MKKKRKPNKTMLRIKAMQKFEVNIKDIPLSRMKQFKEDIKNGITDKRIAGKCTYKIWDIVVVAFLATLGNADDWEEIQAFGEAQYRWLRSFLMLTGGIPSAYTYERVIGVVNTEQLERIVLLFVTDVMNLIRKDKREIDIYSIDGKTDNGSARNASEEREKIKPLNVLNVYSKNAGICIRSEMIEDKSNEIPATKKVVDSLDLKGVVVTWDALNTQKENVRAVIESKGDYVVALKGNHGNFYEDVKYYFKEEKLDIIKTGHKGVFKIEHEKSHGCIIKYEYYQTTDIKWYAEHKEWVGLKSIAMVRTTRTKGATSTVEERYYISSLLNDIDLVSEAMRSHWGVENKLHWTLDFTFKCDANRTVYKNALMNLGILKKAGAGLLGRIKEVYEHSIPKLRYRLSLNFLPEFLRMLNIIDKKVDIPLSKM